MSFPFRELSLESVDAQKESSGGTILKEVDYTSDKVSAEVRDTRTGGKQVVVELKELGSGASIKEIINQHVPATES